MIGIKKLFSLMIFTFALIICWQVNTHAAATVTMTECSQATITVKWTAPKTKVSRYTIKHEDGSIAGTVDGATTSAIVMNYPKNYTGKIYIYYDYVSKGKTYKNKLLGYTFVNTVPAKPAKNSFNVGNVFPSLKKICFQGQRANSNYKLEFRIYKLTSKSYKLVKVLGGDITHSTDFKYATNQVYRFQVRQCYENPSNKKTYYSPWSEFRYFVYPGITYKVKNNKKGIDCTMKKVLGVKSYVIYASKSKDGTYKKTKTITIKKGKTTFHLTKVGKDTMKKGKFYYVKIVPMLKNGPSETVSTANFYCYK